MTKDLLNSRYIVHIDMDAFFAAIEQRDDPSLESRPVIVGSDPKAGYGRGVVSTCSYEARQFGIHSAMPISLAYQKCPEGVFLPVDMDKYCGVSEQIYRILNNFTPLVEPVSIDEAFLDISQTYQLFADSAYNACSVIKSRIRDVTGLTASIGLAPIKMAAKIASDLKKPDGLVEVENGRVLEFLWPLDVSKIWGVGKKSQQRLNERGIHSIGDLARRDVRELIGLLGKNGAYLWELANGRDESEVQAKQAAKSISNEVTFAEDTSDHEKVESVLMYLCEKVSMRLRREGKKCRTITLKIRLKNFQTYTRSVTVTGGTNLVDILNLRVKQLYHDFISSGQDIRLVGVKASDLSAIDSDPGFFPEKLEIKKENIHKAVDKIRCKFGDDSIVRAARKFM